MFYIVVSEIAKKEEEAYNEEMQEWEVIQDKVFVVWQNIPEEDPVFPCVPIEQRFSQSFLESTIKSDVEIPLGWWYDPESGEFSEPPEPELQEPESLLPAVPGSVSQAVASQTNMNAEGTDNTWSPQRVSQRAVAALGRSTPANLGNIPIGTSTTGASTTAKTVRIPGVIHREGLVIGVRFSNANTASQPGLTLNNMVTGNIHQDGVRISNAVLIGNTSVIYYFQRVGSTWVLLNRDGAILPIYSGTTAAGTQAKTFTSLTQGAALTAANRAVGTVIGVVFQGHLLGNSHLNPTFNIAATGAANLRLWNDVGSAPRLGSMPSHHLLLVRWDGTDWLLLNPFEKRIYYGFSITAAATAAKQVLLMHFMDDYGANHRRVGDIVRVAFRFGNTVSQPTLQVQGSSTGLVITPAAPVLVSGQQPPRGSMPGGTLLDFEWDGVGWHLLNPFGMQPSSILIECDGAVTGISPAELRQILGLRSTANTDPLGPIRQEDGGTGAASTINSLPATVSLADAEAGTLTSTRMWTPQRVRQAADAAIAASGNDGSPLRTLLTRADFGNPANTNDRLYGERLMWADGRMEYRISVQVTGFGTAGSAGRSVILPLPTPFTDISDMYCASTPAGSVPGDSNVSVNFGTSGTTSTVNRIVVAISSSNSTSRLALVIVKGYWREYPTVPITTLPT